MRLLPTVFGSDYANLKSTCTYLRPTEDHKTVNMLGLSSVDDLLPQMLVLPSIDIREVLAEWMVQYDLREWTYLRSLLFTATLLVQLEFVNTGMKLWYKLGGRTKVTPVRGKVGNVALRFEGELASGMGSTLRRDSGDVEDVVVAQ